MIQVYKNYIEEDYPDMFFEMANIGKKHVGLPANLWLDPWAVDRHPKHNIPRLKVQGDKSDKIHSDNLIPVSISKNPEILIKNYKSELSSKEWNQIFEFIKNEYDMLMKHATHVIFDSDILLYFVNKYKKK